MSLDRSGARCIDQMVIATKMTEGETNVSSLDLPDGGAEAPGLRYFVTSLTLVIPPKEMKNRARAADGSGIINIAISGGAVVPLLTGLLADRPGSLHFALLLPAACYAIIAAFGIYARRPAQGPVMQSLTS